MNASTFMDKQIMDLSRAKTDDSNTNNKTAINNSDFADLMSPQSEEEINGGSSSSLEKKENILASYDFQPISRSNNPAINDTIPNATARASNFLDSKSNFTPLKSYGSVDSAESSKVLLEKAQKVNDSAILSEIDQALKKYTDNMLHAINSLNARLSNLEKTTRDIEYSVDELRVSIGNNYGISDGKMRQMENILLEVQTGVQDIKDKQEVMEGYVQLAKLQNSKMEKSSEVVPNPNVVHVEPVQPTAASAPQQPSNIQQFPNSVPQPAPSLPPNAVPQQNIHPPPGTSQFPHVQIPAGFTPPGQTPEAQSQQYQILPPAQQQKQQLPSASVPAPSLQPQQHPQQLSSASMPPYPQPPQPPQQQAPQFLPPPLGHHPEESPFMLPQTYSQNVRQPIMQPNGGPQTHQYYGSTSSMYEPSPSGRSSSGLSAYGSPPGAREQYPYGGPVSHYGSGSTIKPRPHSPGGSSGGSNSSYPQIPTARIVPQAIPRAASVSSGSSTGGGSGNRVPVDDLVDKVASMGFPREHVRATVRRLTEDGQSVDLNVVLDKLMNDGEVQPPKGWFGR